jgi:hypothetical protein
MVVGGIERHIGKIERVSQKRRGDLRGGGILTTFETTEKNWKNFKKRHAISAAIKSTLKNPTLRVGEETERVRLKQSITISPWKSLLG